MTNATRPDKEDTAAEVATFHPCSVQVVNGHTGAIEWEPGLVLDLTIPAADLDPELEDNLWANGWDPSDPALPVVSCVSLAMAAEQICDHRLELEIHNALRDCGIRHGRPVPSRPVPSPDRSPTMRYRDPKRAFSDAIAAGILSASPNDPNYAGHYMYMHSEGTRDSFKHHETRAYLRADHSPAS